MGFGLAGRVEVITDGVPHLSEVRVDRVLLSSVDEQGDEAQAEVSFSGLLWNHLQLEGFSHMKNFEYVTWSIFFPRNLGQSGG